MPSKKKGDKRRQPEWDSCPPGTLSALSGKLQGRKQRRRFLKVAGALSLAVLGGGAAVGLGFFLREKPKDAIQEFNFGDISCAQVIQQAQAMATGQVQEPLLGKMRAHIAQCPRCGPLIRSMSMPKKAEG